MNNTEIAHKFFFKFREDQRFVENVKNNSALLRIELYQNLKDNIFLSRELSFYLQWVLELSKSEFYIASPSQGVLQLINKEFKSTVSFMYCTTITDATKKILNARYDELIEIIELHSIEKGHGSRIINEFISLSKKIQLPLALYAETEELVNYYQQFYFKNYGKLGNNEEFLMLRIPN